jgi:ATP-dependent Clp protease protease subunit
MIHQPIGGVRGQASDIEIEAKQILKLKDELYQILADHSNKTLKQIEADADRNFWMTAQEAVKYGMIDSVLTKSGTNSKKSKRL